MEKGRAVESISRPQCLPEQTGSLAASQADGIILAYEGDEQEMKKINQPQQRQRLYNSKPSVLYTDYLVNEKRVLQKELLQSTTRLEVIT